jgi:hypothetical protein
MSIRGDEWMAFAKKVHEHIEYYTVPQYGDKGEDQITNYSADDCVTAIKKYANRFGQNQREGQQKLDFMKVAHYAQCAHDKADDVMYSENKQTFVGTSEDTMNEVDEWVYDKGFYGKNVKITVELL